MRKRVFPPVAILLLSTLVACSSTLEAYVERGPTLEIKGREPTPEATRGEGAILEMGIENTPSPRPGNPLGRLAYVQDGDVWAKELPDGAPERLTVDGRNVNPRWSPSGEWLIFEKEMALWAMRADGNDARPLVAPGVPRQIAWSPMEDHLAYITEEGSLVLTSPPGHPPGWLEGTLIRTTTPEYAQQVTRFAWSPDGQWLACEIIEYADLSRDTLARQVLRVVRRDGEHASDLLAIEVSADLAGGGLQLVGWSGDGTHLLFWQWPVSQALPATSVLPQGLELMRIPSDDGDSQSLATPPSVAPNLVAPRPASAQVALVAGGGQESFLERQLVLVDTSGSSLRLLSEAGQLVTAQVPQAAPAWSPDGQRIAYAAMPAPKAEHADEAVDDEILNERLGERRIWMVGADGSGRRQITDDPAYRDEWPRWSADGQYILFVRVRAGRASMWLMDNTGDGLHQVVDGLGIAPEASYFDGDRLFDWWTGPKSPLRPEDRLSTTTTQGGAAQQAVMEFLQAVESGDVEGALSYWNLEQPDVPDNYAESIRRTVTGWADGECQFTVGLTTYRGLVAPGDYRTLEEDDPRVQSASVEVRIDGLERWFSVRIVNDHWKIEGLMTP